MNYQFVDYKEEISNSASVIFIDYDVDDSLSEFIDQHFVSICYGNRNSSLQTVKRDIKLYLSGKTQKQKIGAVAEFFAHLYFVNCGYKQECMFKNMEEASAKKGFDGIYSDERGYWVMESKARNYSKKITHSSIISKAYSDLEDKFSGKSHNGELNNPWRNAYNHALHGDINSSASLKKQFNQLADDYTNCKYRKCSDFNIIPCSTIINDEIRDVVKRNKLINQIKKRIVKFQYKRIVCVAVSNRIFDFFLKYLEV